MSRFAPYLGIVTALLVGIFVMTILGSVTTLQIPVVSNTSSTVSVLPNAVLPPTTLPSLEPRVIETSVS
ncbi:MAG: hypothetical protein Q7R58_02670, partial [bacterium]|nr:hypothetical protein [bacterium]